MTVNKGRVALLVAALRSGEYRKGTGKLHRTTRDPDGTAAEGWCCLGVASDLASKSGAPVTRTTISDTFGQEIEAFDGEDSYMPSSVQEWFGFSSSNPQLLLLPYGGSNSAASVNDGGIASPEGGDRVPVTFAEIAGFFEATFLHY